MAVNPVSRAPLIGISAVPREVPTGYGGDLADTVATGLIQGVEAAGGIPVVLPIVPAPHADRQIEHLDGIVLSGGQDLDLPPPDEAAIHGERWIHPERDAHEFALWKAACRRQLPVLGVCRGLQLVNVALGGDLHFHVDGHDSANQHAERPHDVEVAPGSRLEEAIGAARASVNSIHHQAVKDLGSGLAPCAWSADRMIEAAELGGEHWFVGVQWHPELMLGTAAGQGLFDALVREAGRR